MENMLYDLNIIHYLLFQQVLFTVIDLEGSYYLHMTAIFLIGPLERLTGNSSSFTNKKSP
ncbi:hypothetical protein A7K69_11560 [Parageobacillus thermoglucosidasius]|uniref:Uncharacterized protein n=1 Tax=Parageobacillus thermoglucosidasius TaxID=1426 RepID=A0A1B7KPN3_PARTM|nr:hypothetical protein A7K69_11560 [Parageobacillus thermoglucosidasius]